MRLDMTGVGSVADFAKSLVDRFWPPAASEQERLAGQLQLQQLLEARDTAVLETQRAVITAEMAQGDNFTKRARPAIVYFGLAAIGLVHVLLPMIAWGVLVATSKPLADMPAIQLPHEFWLTWGGVCSIWVIGRSVEKNGVSNKLVGLITGGK